MEVAGKYLFAEDLQKEEFVNVMKSCFSNEITSYIMAFSVKGSPISSQTQVFPPPQ